MLCLWRMRIEGGSWSSLKSGLCTGNRCHPHRSVPWAKRGSTKSNSRLDSKHHWTSADNSLCMPSKEPDRPLHIVMTSSEAVPFSKTGGLADVVGALAPEFAKLGHDIHLIIPRHRLIEAKTFHFEEFDRVTVPTAMGEIETVVERVKNDPRCRTRGK